MNWDRIEGDWRRFKVNAKLRWTKLTEEQLSAVAGRRETMSSSISSGSNSRSSTGIRSSDSGRRIAMPSSLQSTWTSRP